MINLLEWHEMFVVVCAVGCTQLLPLPVAGLLYNRATEQLRPALSLSLPPPPLSLSNEREYL